MTRLPVIVMFLLIGHAALGGLYWALLNVPESNVAMLALSVLLVLLMVLVAGWIEAAGLLSWMTDDRPGAILKRALRGGPSFVVALGIFGAIWFATAAALGWHDRHSGEIDAFVMSRFGSARTGWLHVVYTSFIWFVRWVVGLGLALSLLSAGAALGSRAIVKPAWLTRALHPRRLLAIAALLIVFVVLPWQFVFWRPRVLPPTTVELVFVAAKMGVIAIVAHVGWALILRTVSR